MNDITLVLRRQDFILRTSHQFCADGMLSYMNYSRRRDAIWRSNTIRLTFINQPRESAADGDNEPVATVCSQQIRCSVPGPQSKNGQEKWRMEGRGHHEHDREGAEFEEMRTRCAWRKPPRHPRGWHQVRHHVISFNHCYESQLLGLLLCHKSWIWVVTTWTTIRSRK